MTDAVAGPFEALAATYDETFTRGRLGTLLRQAVWRHADAAFAPGQHVLDLGCGTGEDALHLAGRGVRVTALDAAEAMVAAARSKTEGQALVTVRHLPIERLDELPGVFDGALSNFGALNCVSDLDAAARALASRLAPGARALLCVMGPLAPWEWAVYLARGEPRKAFRRLARGGVAWRGVTIFYPSVARVRRAFDAGFRYSWYRWGNPFGVSPSPFRLEAVRAIGALLPPTYLEPWAARHPRLVAALDRWERRLEALPPLPWLSDHTLLTLVRR